MHEEERDKEREGERETERQRERERECVCEVRGNRVRDQWKRSLCARETEGRERQKRRGRKKGILFGMCIKVRMWTSTVCARLFSPESLCLYSGAYAFFMLCLNLSLGTCCNMRRRELHFHLEHQGRKSTAVAERGLVPKPTMCGPIHT